MLLWLPSEEDGRISPAHWTGLLVKLRSLLNHEGSVLKHVRGDFNHTGSHARSAVKHARSVPRHARCSLKNVRCSPKRALAKSSLAWMSLGLQQVFLGRNGEAVWRMY